MVRSGSELGGAAGAARQFFSRNRVLLLSIVLSAVGVVTGIATASAILSGASLGDAALIFAGTVLAGAVALFHTRHLALAFLTAVAPLPGLAWAAPLSADARFGAVPMLAYAFAYGIAVMLAQNILVRTLDGRETKGPFLALALSLAATAALAVLWFWRSTAGGAVLQAILDLLFSAGSAMLLMPVCTSFLHFDEAFVGQANRAREHRLRLLEKIAMTAVPRWGMSIAGIALIFLALAWFGAQSALTYTPGGEAIAAASIGLIFAIAGIAGGGWREALAATVVAVLACLVGLWAFAVVTIGTAPSGHAGLLEVVALALFLVLCGFQRVRIYRRLGDDPAIARLRAVEDLGGAQAFAVLGGIAALLPAVFFHSVAAAYAIALAFVAIGAVGFAPALVSATEFLLPRRRSVEEMYGRR
ncbi:MAG: hypothetical protein KGL29_14445 [Alphaproteobacteria bacterium]|nr:hypothetical protein [Alphaproteobacteria bacterium]